MSQFKEGDILQFKTHFNIRRIITEARSTGYSYLRSAADERIHVYMSPKIPSIHYFKTAGNSAIRNPSK